MDKFSEEETKIFQQLLAIPFSKGEKTKAIIILATINLISESGFLRLTYEKIGEKLHLKKSRIHYYFPSIRELLYLAVAYAALTGQQITAEEVARAKSPEKKLHAICHGAFQWLKTRPEHGDLFLLMFSMTRTDEKIRHLYEQIRLAGQNRINHALQLFFGEKNRKTKRLAEQIQNLITGQLVGAFTTQTKDLDRVNRQTQELISTMIHAQK